MPVCYNSGMTDTKKAEKKKQRSQKENGCADKAVSRISVRTLVEFLLRSGNIDADSRRGPDPEAALAGARMHRKLQAGRGSEYESEVFLQMEREFEELLVRVEGRADGVIHSSDEASGEERTAVEEIKGMYLDVTALKDAIPVHLAQAKCYAAMLADRDTLPSVSVQMTYVNLESEELRRFQYEYSAEELRTWFWDLMGQWHRWARWELLHKRSRDASMQGLEFPFPYREGQQKLTAAVYHTIREGKTLFLMAPTGVGKTMSCVFPAVRAVGEGYGDKIFYLTGKNETLKAGREAFSILQENGLDYLVVQITAKEKICPLSEPSCSPLDCPYAKGHFDRVNEAVFELLHQSTVLDRTAILAQAERRKVCPFELTLDVASWCDAVLCDYNYVFDPDASLKRFFANGTKGEYLFLIDEAHNLVERGRQMYSAVLRKEDVLAAKRAVGTASKPLKRALERVNKQLLEMKKSGEEHFDGEVLSQKYKAYSPKELAPLLLSVTSLYGKLQAFYEDSEESALKEKLLDFYFEVRSFITCAEQLDENYRPYLELSEKGECLVTLFCINPGPFLTRQTGKGRSAVYFSATLLPVEYYKSMLTAEEHPYAIYAPSPFDISRRLLLVATDVSTRYTERGPQTYRRIAEYISIVSRARTGNYLVFFPSYSMMREVFSLYRAKYDSPEVNWVMQSAGMREEDREIFLEDFYEDPETSLVGFCVMGGMFSEGLDLTGTRLIGAIIVGAGIPQVSNEREILKKASGFSYAYLYPGMNKVQQAAGRVIRTATDSGVVLLLDHRLLTPQYRALYPREWNNYRSCTLESAPALLAEFWQAK